MLDLKEFYRGFQVNFFDYKIVKLKEELESFENQTYEFENKIIGYNKADHLRSIKIDIRQTYFQAIETVFELVYSFKPPKKGSINELNLLINISRRKDNYEEIRRFSKRQGGFEFLDQKVKLETGKDLSLLHYIFYLGADESFHAQIPESVDAIFYCLRILAADIADRREYNCLKHGLRVYRALNEIRFHDANTKEKLVELDLSDSVTFMDTNLKTGKVEFMTKVFDSKRDIKMTALCSH